MNRSSVWGAVTALALAGTAGASAVADEPMSPDDFRIYCGYLEESQNAKYQKMSPKKRDAAIAARAHVTPKKLAKILAQGGAFGDSCDAIVKGAEKSITDALQGTRVKGRVEFVEVTAPDWDKLVVRVRWKGEEDRFLEEEAATVAWTVHHTLPMVKEIGVAAYDPTNPENTWFEGIIANRRLGNIEKDRIDSFADTRYIRLFDNRKFANPRP
ncbi:MAG: hypothetical protein JXR83_05095 [Deltaproteobacteria bacterium]|nr:hypothetical protein [Deltaproteobacteria bacterium]